MTKRRSDPRLNRRPRRDKPDNIGMLPPPYQERPPLRSRKIDIHPKNEAQNRYLNLMGANDLTFGLGPAGTGKTFLAAAKAAEWYESGLVDRIYVTRPAVEAGENLGFLPGDMGEKIAPYFAPVREALEYKLGKGQVEYMIENGYIEFVPVAYMRGRSLNNAALILDEAQNTTPTQMKMLLTRAGERTRMIVTGDLLQSDLPGLNGLLDAVNRFEGRKGVAVMKFRRNEVVRSGLAALAVDVYEGGDRREQDDVLDNQLPLFLTR